MKCLLQTLKGMQIELAEYRKQSEHTPTGKQVIQKIAKYSARLGEIRKKLFHIETDIDDVWGNRLLAAVRADRRFGEFWTYGEWKGPGRCSKHESRHRPGGH